MEAGLYGSKLKYGAKCEHNRDNYVPYLLFYITFLQYMKLFISRLSGLSELFL